MFDDYQIILDPRAMAARVAGDGLGNYSLFIYLLYVPLVFICPVSFIQITAKGACCHVYVSCCSCSFLHFLRYFFCPLYPGPVELCSRCGGTVGAILTCPLEVVKTRLQSSSITLYISEVQLSTVNGAGVARVAPPGPLHCLK